MQEFVTFFDDLLVSAANFLASEAIFPFVGIFVLLAIARLVRYIIGSKV